MSSQPHIQYAGGVFAAPRISCEGRSSLLQRLRSRAGAALAQFTGIVTVPAYSAASRKSGCAAVLGARGCGRRTPPAEQSADLPLQEIWL